MDTNDTSRARGPGRLVKAEENAAPEKPQSIEVVVVRPYRPMNDDVLAGLEMSTVGVSAKLPVGTLVELPIEEAKRGIRGGFLNFPAQDI